MLSHGFILHRRTDSESERRPEVVLDEAAVALETHTQTDTHTFVRGKSRQRCSGTADGHKDGRGCEDAIRQRLRLMIHASHRV